MIRSRIPRLVIAGSVLLLSGCAVGRFITGGPEPGTSQPKNELLVRRCSGCHDVPDPASMSAVSWQAALERMKLRMGLTVAEWDSLAAMRRDEAAVAPRSAH